LEGEICDVLFMREGLCVF